MEKMVRQVQGKVRRLILMMRFRCLWGVQGDWKAKSQIQVRLRLTTPSGSPVKGSPLCSGHLFSRSLLGSPTKDPAVL